LDWDADAFEVDEEDLSLLSSLEEGNDPDKAPMPKLNPDVDDLGAAATDTPPNEKPLNDDEVAAAVVVVFASVSLGVVDVVADGVPNEKPPVVELVTPNEKPPVVVVDVDPNVSPVDDPPPNVNPPLPIPDPESAWLSFSLAALSS